MVLFEGEREQGSYGDVWYKKASFRIENCRTSELRINNGVFLSHGHAFASTTRRSRKKFACI